MVRLTTLIGCIGLLLVLSLVLLRRSDPDFIRDEKMQLPQIISGVWVNGFEESSFFPSEAFIPDRNDPRRYRLELIVDKEQFYKLRGERPNLSGYVAYRVTFLGRRTKYPIAIDCQGDRHYYFIPDLFLQTQFLGPIADPDRPMPKPGRYKPFKRSGEGGVIREMEDQALAHCGGSARPAS